MARRERDQSKEERRQEQIVPPDDAEDRSEEVRLYNASREDMPPGTAGAGVEDQGEAAASRRVAGLPPALEREPGHIMGEPTPGAEPFLGYDGLPADDLIGWIDGADPDPADLRRVFDYEQDHRAREAVLHELSERLRRWGERPERPDAREG